MAIIYKCGIEMPAMDIVEANHKNSVPPLEDGNKHLTICTTRPVAATVITKCSMKSLNK